MCQGSLRDARHYGPSLKSAAATSAIHGLLLSPVSLEHGVLSEASAIGLQKTLSRRDNAALLLLSRGNGEVPSHRPALPVGNLQLPGLPQAMELDLCTRLY